jgi:hypothetical protein
MASFCVLHKDPSGARGTFVASAAPDPKLLASLERRRTRIWDLSELLHCSIVGTCLTAAELRRLFIRFGDSAPAIATDHGVHCWGVFAASRRDDGGKLLNKVLDKRHEAAIRRFTKAETPTQLRTLWKQALDHGDIAGPYWALLTHPATDVKPAQDVFGDIHMLSHQVGAAARLDVARLRHREVTISERDDKSCDNRRVSKRPRRSGRALRETIERLELRLASLDGAAAHAPPETAAGEIEALRRALADESARGTSLTLKLKASNEERARTEEECRGAIARANLAVRELAALEMAFRPADEGNGTPKFGAGLRGAKILYVGGRPKLIEQLKVFISARGGELIAHDGGVDNNLALLPGLISQADAVYFPVDCISHSAAEKIKKLYLRLAKTWSPLRTASLASFVSEIAAHNDLHQRQLTAAE